LCAIPGLVSALLLMGWRTAATALMASFIYPCRTWLLTLSSSCCAVSPSVSSNRMIRALLECVTRSLASPWLFRQIEWYVRCWNVWHVPWPHLGWQSYPSVCPSSSQLSVCWILSHLFFKVKHLQHGTDWSTYKTTKSAPYKV
jgi:hypothetical protein